MKRCHDGAACQMQDKAVCFHACAVRAQGPAADMLNACSALISAIGRHHASKRDPSLGLMWDISGTREVYRDHLDVQAALDYLEARIAVRLEQESHDDRRT